MTTEQNVFVLTPDEWETFTDLLDRPAIEKPRLRRLLNPPSDPSVADPTDHEPHEGDPA